MNMEQLLTAMDALAVSAEKPRAVTIKGLGEVYVRQVTIGEINAQIADTSDNANKLQAARGATRLLCDENGKRLLDPENFEHVQKMAKLPVSILETINNVWEDKETGN